MDDKDPLIAIPKLFEPLYDDVDELDGFHRRKPYLAHYTSLDALEKILANNEIWFSNPLLMNDFEEVRFGIHHGTDLLIKSPSIAEALGSSERRELFTEQLYHCVTFYEQNFLFDTYVFCLSEWDANFPDGLLSMWRGYGGNGKGAALVLDASKLTLAPDNTPLALDMVHYGSTDTRKRYLQENVVDKAAAIIAANNIPNDRLILAVHSIYLRIKLFALFSKHTGFSEEREWRAVYLPERDPNKLLSRMMHYTSGPRGIEPKLKLKIEHIPGVTPEDFSLDTLIAGIIIGPTLSTTLTEKSLHRMFELIEKPHLRHRLRLSTIPFRS